MISPNKDLNYNEKSKLTRRVPKRGKGQRGKGQRAKGKGQRAKIWKTPQIGQKTTRKSINLKGNQN